MSTGSSQKTEQPTPKRLEDARKKGQVARSQELVTTLSLFTVVAYLWLGWDLINQRLQGLFDSIAVHAREYPNHRTAVALYEAGLSFALILAPILGIVVVVGTFASFVQVGGLISVDAVIPKGDRINPGSGLRRIFSRRHAVELLKTILKIAVLVAILFGVIRDAIGPYVNSLYCNLGCQSGLTSLVLSRLIAYAAVAFFFIAVADVAFQRRAHIRSLMMTREEVKREFKEMEGDPLLKSKRRQLAQELAMEDRVRAAGRATAIIVNPTHLAVAIFYSAEKVPVPVVTAKGRNQEAYQMIGAAEKAGVPVFRNIMLARKLFADVEVSQPVPEELFDAIAEVLAWIANNKEVLYSGRLPHGVIDMEDLRRKKESDSS